MGGWETTQVFLYRWMAGKKRSFGMHGRTWRVGGLDE
jgi:hypothetical protein